MGILGFGVNTERLSKLASSQEMTQNNENIRTAE